MEAKRTLLVKIFGLNAVSLISIFINLIKNALCSHIGSELIK